jgi:hypothetical protein
MRHRRRPDPNRWCSFAPAWHTLAVALQRSGQYRESLDAFDRLLRLRPGDFTAHTLRSLLTRRWIMRATRRTSWARSPAMSCVAIRTSQVG